MLFYSYMETPVGQILIGSSEIGVARIMLPEREKSDLISRLKADFPESTLINDEKKNLTVREQLQKYFNCTLTEFSVPLDLHGTDFQKSVWHKVAKVPYGHTRSYGDIARSIGHPKAYRAVGAAMRDNPIPIIIPCHRIIGSNGSLTGFRGGLPMKKRLLQLEKSVELKNGV